MIRAGLRLLALAVVLLCVSLARAERYAVPLLVPAGAPGAAQGVLRILNGTDETGSVEIYAIDDAGMRSGPASFTLNGSAAVEFTAADLASGNAMLGLSGGIGTDVGDARLELVTDLQIVPLAYVRAADGTLSAMHDTVRAAAVDGAEGHRYEVPLFNPASDVVHESRLRLINPGNAAASVTIGGRGDRGTVAAGASVQLTLAAGTARTLTALQLEAGDTGLTGRLGAGVGRWRLTVSSDQPIHVINTVFSASGYMNNLSTTALDGVAGNPSVIDDADGGQGGNDPDTPADGGDEALPGSLGVCRPGMTLSGGQRCTYPETAHEFSINSRGRGSFLDRLAGIRIRIDSETIDGRVYDFVAEHQGDGVWRIDRVEGRTEPQNVGPGGMEPQTDGSGGTGAGATAEGDFVLGGANANPSGIAFGQGRFHVLDWLDRKVYAYSDAGQREPAGDFDLDGANGNPGGIAFAGGRFHVVDWQDDKIYAYSASGRHEPAADFDLDGANGNPAGVVFAGGRFHVVDSLDDRVYGYSTSGRREPAADFDLASANGNPQGIAYADGRFHVLDWTDVRVYAYSASGRREPVADFNLHEDNASPLGIAFVGGRFYVADAGRARVFVYASAGQPMAQNDSPNRRAP